MSSRLMLLPAPLLEAGLLLALLRGVGLKFELEELFDRALGGASYFRPAIVPTLGSMVGPLVPLLA